MDSTKLNSTKVKLAFADELCCWRGVLAAVALMAALVVPNRARALDICARDDGTGQPRVNSKLTLRAVCTPGKEVLVGSSGALVSMSKVDTDNNGIADTVRFEGVDVQIVSGAGATDATVTGRGNLIVGYNERTDGQLHSGSHNLIVGSEQEYSSYGGLLAGSENSVKAPYASVSGGRAGNAWGANSSVSGGYNGSAMALQSSVTGGYANQATGARSVVSGGAINEANGVESVVGGGSGFTNGTDYSWHAERVAGFPTGSAY